MPATPPPTVTVVEKPTNYQFYTVDGNVNDAISSANTHFEGSFAGKAETSINISFDNSQNTDMTVSSAASKTRTVDVTAEMSNMTITVTATVQLPKWSGYNDASETDKQTWDNFISQLKSHEDGHVEIARHIAQELKTNIEKNLINSAKIEFKYTVRNPKNLNAEITAAAVKKFNLSKIRTIRTNALASNQTLQTRYDNDSNHRENLQQLRERGITYW